MAGHVFIAEGDITRLACDAWLLPSDRALVVEPSWFAAAPPAVLELRGPDDRLHIPTPADWCGRKLRVAKVGPWQDRHGRCQAWLTDVGGVPGTDPGWYLDGVREFFSSVAQDLGTPSDSPWRARPLVALPVVGTGEGGAGTIKGEVTAALLQLLHDEASHRPFDIVLVTRGHRALSAAQRVRELLLQNRGHDRGWLGWAELGSTLEDRAHVLAANAQCGPGPLPGRRRQRQRRAADLDGPRPETR